MQGNYLLFSTWCFISVCGTLRIPFIDFHEAAEINLEVTNVIHDRLRRSSDRLPRELSVSLSNTEIDVALRIIRNYDIDVNAPVTVERNVGSERVIVQENLEYKKTIGLYQSTENGSVFLVEAKTDVNMTVTYQFTGTFFVGSQEYHMQPSDDRFGKGYGVQKVKTHPYTQMDTMDGPVNDNGASSGVFTSRHRRKRSSVKYTIEILFVADYSVYKFWYDKSTKLSSLEKDKEAKHRMREFFAFTLTGMDLRYKSVTGGGYSLGLAFAGLHIADTVSSSSWTENSAVKNLAVFPVQVNAKAALDSFHSWVNLQMNAKNLPDNDHAMLFTKYDIQDQGRVDVVGLSHDIGTVCTNGSQTIVEAHFDGAMIQTAAHELGHSMGAWHDGYNNDCQTEDGYVMSPVTEVDRDLEKNRRLWIFSSCSLDYFDSYISQLNERGTNCLTTFGSTYNSSALIEFDDELAGQVYSPDTQCRNFEGNSSYMCREFYVNGDYTSICGILFCQKADDDECEAYLPLEGTSCGDRKLCSNGRCVASQEAPALPDRCTFGDQPGTLSSDLPTCGNIVEFSVELCPRVADVCCKSCVGHTECVDKSDSCYFQEWDCESNSVALQCCKTCSRTRQTQSPLPKPPSTLFCSSEIVHGTLHDDCTRKLYTSCGVTCDKGYKTKNKYVTCTENATWSEQCEVVTCSLTDWIPEGYLQYGCNNSAGHKCTVRCDGQTDSKQITCGQTGAWIEDLNFLCTTYAVSEEHGSITAISVAVPFATIIFLAVLASSCTCWRLNRKRNEQRLGNAGQSDRNPASGNPRCIIVQTVPARQSSADNNQFENRSQRPVFTTQASTAAVDEVNTPETVADDAILTQDSWLREQSMA